MAKLRKGGSPTSGVMPRRGVVVPSMHPDLRKTRYDFRWYYKKVAWWYRADPPGDTLDAWER